MKLSFKKNIKQNNVPTEKFIIESVQNHIKESKYPKQLLLKKLDLILEQNKAKVVKTNESINLMKNSLKNLQEKNIELEQKNTKEIFRLKSVIKGK